MKYVIATAFVFPIALGHVAEADSLSNFSESVGDSADASARIIASGGQVAIGAVVLPLSATGVVLDGSGAAVGTLADEMWKAANAPLRVDEDVVVAMAPPSLDTIRLEETR